MEGAPLSVRRMRAHDAQEELALAMSDTKRSMKVETCDNGQAEVELERARTVQGVPGRLGEKLEEDVSHAMESDMPGTQGARGKHKKWDNCLERRCQARMANQAGCKAMELGAPAVAAVIFDVAMEAQYSEYDQLQAQPSRTRHLEDSRRFRVTSQSQTEALRMPPPGHARDKGKGKVGEEEVYETNTSLGDEVKRESHSYHIQEDSTFKLYYNAGLARLSAGDPLGAICAFRCAKHFLVGDPCLWIRLAEAYLEVSDACTESQMSLPPSRVQLVLRCHAEANFSMEAASRAADCLNRASVLLQQPFDEAVPKAHLYAKADKTILQTHILMKLSYASLRIGATRAAVVYACQLLEMKDCPETYQALANLYWAESLATEENYAAAHKMLKQTVDLHSVSLILDDQTLSALEARLLDLEKFSTCNPQTTALTPSGARPEVY